MFVCDATSEESQNLTNCSVGGLQRSSLRQLLVWRSVCDVTTHSGGMRPSYAALDRAEMVWLRPGLGKQYLVFFVMCFIFGAPFLISLFSTRPIAHTRGEIDTNHDGKLSRSELHKVGIDVHEYTKHHTNVTHLLSQAPASALMAAATSRITAAWAKLAKARGAREVTFDTDRDGKLTKAELVRAGVNVDLDGDGKASPHEVDAAIAAAHSLDSDRDGRIGAKEVATANAAHGQATNVRGRSRRRRL